MTQLIGVVNGQQQLIKAYDNAQKLFHIGDLPAGVLTYGVGNIGRRSIESFVHEFSRGERDTANGSALNTEELAQRFYVFMQAHYATAFGALPPEQQPAMGFIIAGLSEAHHLASEWEFVLPQHSAPQPVRPQDSVGAAWRGISSPFSRMMFGIDPLLEPQLAQAGMPAAQIDLVKRVAGGMATQIPFDGMPLQDAIGYCKFIIQSTVNWCTYAMGVAACGGPIRLAVITRSGFDWITPQKHYLEGEKHAH